MRKKTVYYSPKLKAIIQQTDIKFKEIAEFCEMGHSVVSAWVTENKYHQDMPRIRFLMLLEKLPEYIDNKVIFHKESIEKLMQCKTTVLSILNNPRMV
jgi:hypothetical protein